MGSARVSTKPPFVPTRVTAPRLAPSGFAIVTCVEQQGDGPIVTLLRRRLTRCPAWPSKKSQAFSFADCVVTVTGAPPGVIS